MTCSSGVALCLSGTSGNDPGDARLSSARRTATPHMDSGAVAARRDLGSSGCPGPTWTAAACSTAELPDRRHLCTPSGAVQAVMRLGARQYLGNLSRGENRRSVLLKAMPGAAQAHCVVRQAEPNRGSGHAHSRRTRELERTCDDCGHVWRLPRWAAPPLQVQGRPVSGGCEQGVPPPAAAVIADPVVAATAQAAGRAAVFFRSCHECGSERYKQRSIWSWTGDPAC